MPEYMIVVIRTVLSFIVLLILARLLGKKQIAQLTFFDYITGITIGNISAQMAVDTTLQVTNGLIGMVIYTILTILIAYGAIKSFKFRQLVEGSATTLIQNGNVLEDNLAKVKMTYDDLMLGLREKNTYEVADVATATLETSGNITVMKKPEHQALTPSVIGMMVEPEHHKPSLVIIDGQLLEKHLNYLGYTKEWLLGETIKQGAEDFNDVFLAQIDSKGHVYVDLYNDQAKVTQVKQKPLLAAQLRKMQADLEGFAIQTNDPNAKQMYYNQSKELQDLIDKMNPLLK